MKVYYNKLGKRYSWDIDVRNDGNTLTFRFNYNKQVVEEIKALAGARWNPDHKYWTAPASKRNLIALEILQGDYTIYEWYDQPLMNDVKLPDDVKAFQHQVHGVKHIITKKRTLIAGEPGVGKTLLALLGLFNTECTTPLIVAPHSALAQWKRELIKWGFHRMYPWRWSTYESLQKILTKRRADIVPPIDYLILDESVKIKNPTTNRAKLVQELIDMDEPEYVTCLSGVIAPRDPRDWHNQIEVLAPGYIREGDRNKLGKRLGHWQEIDGQIYKKNIGWDDDEIQAFAKRISPIVYSIKKSDVFDFPPQVFESIEIPISDEYSKLARYWTLNEPSQVILLTRLRELSDGFSHNAEGELVDLPNSPKELLLKERLDFYEPAKRIVISAAFTQSIQKCLKACKVMGWHAYESHGRSRPTPKDLDHFASDSDDLLAMVVHPACVYGLNLSASPTIQVYSNDFNSDSRAQLIERCDRPGKEGHSGTKIDDYIHLPSDLKVLNNLNAKLNVYNFTVEEIRRWFS
jgi:hypothetical protein